MWWIRGCGWRCISDNYDATATDPGTCEYEGCTDSNYLEYNSNANVDDGSCETIIIFGCTNELALNYEASANKMMAVVIY